MSFVALAILWPRPKLATAPSRALPDALQRILLSPALRAVLGAVSFALLVLVLVAGLIGTKAPPENLTPTFVYIIFWLGIPALVVLFGNIWPALNPWAAAADGAAWLTRRAGIEWTPPGRYPEETLGRWPAAGVLAAFTMLELVYVDPANPRVLALAIWLYSGITWFGMAVFGRDVWLRNGEGFSVYFGLLSGLAPFGRRDDGQLVVRPPLAGLASHEPRPGTLGVVAVLLGSVAFDGFSYTAWWQDRLFLRSDTELMLLNLLGLLVAIGLAALVYLLALAGARAAAGRGVEIGGAFLASLIPIAFAYAFAHYFTNFLRTGQLAIPLASDPLGEGWDLFGTAGFDPNLTLISGNTVWYVQTAALVIGHVFGLVIAHDKAVAMFERRGIALRTQYAMLVLMVLYTVAGLLLLWNGG